MRRPLNMVFKHIAIPGRPDKFVPHPSQNKNGTSGNELITALARLEVSSG